MFRIANIEARVIRMETRIPFRFGITEMTETPHVVVQVEVESEGRTKSGWASEHMLPKWFTKDPQSAVVDDIVDMVQVIDHAIGIARGKHASSAFDLWWGINEEQARWAENSGIPGLLAGLGTALVERAVIDAVCRLLSTPFDRAIRTGVLGFDASRVHPELSHHPSLMAFPPRSASTMRVRHTIGLSDPLTPAEVANDPSDGLPVSLEAVIQRYGVSHFKIKTAGDLNADLSRLRRIFDLTHRLGVDAWFTIDGNESMTTVDDFESWAKGLMADPNLSSVLRERLIAVEQPFHRSVAMKPEIGAGLRRSDFPVIIDESDDTVIAVRSAMDLGYAGGTYKGCKGVFRGLANAALVRYRGSSTRTIITAEDLSTVPPLTVQQDLVVSSVMGLSHIERNGHHYFGQVAPLDSEIESTLAARHPDAFARGSDGRVRLTVRDGHIALASMLAAPFGVEANFDLGALAPLTPETAIRGMAQ